MSLSCSHCMLWWLWRWLMLNKKMKNLCWEQRPKSPPITCRVRLVLWFWLSLPQEIQECFWVLRLGPLGARKSNQFRILEVFENWKEGVWVRNFCRVWLFDRLVVWSTELLRDDGIGRRDQPSFLPVGTTGYLIGGNFLPKRKSLYCFPKYNKNNPFFLLFISCFFSGGFLFFGFKFWKLKIWTMLRPKLFKRILLPLVKWWLVSSGDMNLHKHTISIFHCLLLIIRINCNKNCIDNCGPITTVGSKMNP